MLTTSGTSSAGSGRREPQQEAGSTTRGPPSRPPPPIPSRPSLQLLEAEAASAVAPSPPSSGVVGEEPPKASPSAAPASGAHPTRPSVDFPRFSRLAEFFIVVGVKKPLPTLLDGSNVTGEVIDVLPRPPEEGNPIRDVSMFCFPDGISMKFEEDPVKFHTFVLTDMFGGRLYGFCLVFPEKHLLPAVTSVPPPVGHKHWPKYGFVSKCLCIISAKAFLNTFKRYLSSLYLLSKEQGLTCPLEFYLANFLLETPSPPQGRIDITLSLPSIDFVFYQPSRHEFPLLDFSLRSLFECLEVERILQLILCMMLEKKILLYSRHTALLSIVCEGISALLFPFRWSRVYIPLLSRNLLDYTDAPTPFIMGVHSSYLTDLPPIKEVVFVDLDHNKLETTEQLPDFPVREKANLIERLLSHIHPALETIDLAFPAMSNNVELELTPERWTSFHEKRIRVAFFMFFADLVGNYQFSKESNASTDESFIADQPETSKEFYEKFFATEVWYSFVEERKKHGDDLFEDFLNFREEQTTRKTKTPNSADVAKEKRRERDLEISFLMDRFSTCSHHLTMPKPSFDHLTKEREEAVRKILTQRHFDARVEREVWKKCIQDWKTERAKQLERERLESAREANKAAHQWQDGSTSPSARQRSNSMQNSQPALSQGLPTLDAPVARRPSRPLSTNLGSALSATCPEPLRSSSPTLPANSSQTGRPKLPISQALSMSQLPQIRPPATPGPGGPGRPAPLMGLNRTPAQSTSRQRRDMLQHMHKSQKEIEKAEIVAANRGRPAAVSISVQRRGHRRSKSVAIGDSSRAGGSLDLTADHTIAGLGTLSEGSELSFGQSNISPPQSMYSSQDDEDDIEEEEEREDEEDNNDDSASIEEPWYFQRLNQQVFEAFDPRYDQLVEQLSRRISSSPEIAQLYMLRGRIYAELGDLVASLRDHDTVWSLMYGHARVIAENKQQMKTLFPLLDEHQLEEAAKIGTYTESRISHFLKKQRREHEPEEEEAAGEDRDNKVLDSLDKSADLFDSTNSPLSPRAKGASAVANPALVVISPPPLKDEADGDWDYKVQVGKFLSALPAVKKIHRRDFVDYAISVGLAPDVNDAKLLFGVIVATKKAATSKYVMTNKLTKFIKSLQSTYSQTISWLPRLARGEIVLRISSSSVTTSSGARGYIILTNHRLLFSPKKSQKKTVEFCHLANIVKIERYNFKILIPPGLPCLNIYDKTQRTYETFCFLSWVERDIWMSCLNEMQVAYEIAIDLSDPRFICHTAHRLMLSESIYRIKKRYIRTLFTYADFTTQSFYQIAKRLEARGILNTSHLWDSKNTARHACIVSEDLLGAIVALFFAHVLPDGHQVDFKALATSPEFQKFEEASAELQKVNLAQLDAKERTAFFINVYNVLAIHGFVVTGFPRCQLDWRYFARTACYDIAGLPFSLDEIHHGLLRGNRAGPWFSKKRFAEDDPRMRFTIEQPDYRVLFALSVHSQSSPCLRLYDAENLNVWLNLATEEYISSTVHIVPAKDKQTIQQLQLPEMLRWYYRDFLEFHGGEGKESTKEGDASPSSAGPLGGAGSPSLTHLLRNIVLPFLSGGKRKAVQALLAAEGASYDVKWVYSWTPSPKPFRQL